MEKQSQEVLLTVKEAAELLNSSKQAIYGFISSGRLTAIKPSERKTLIRRSDIDKFFEASIYKPKVK